MRQALEPLIASPQVGALFENLVLGELVRARDHRGLSLNLQYFRTKEGDEIDFLIEAHGAHGTRWFALEAKFGIQRVDAVGPPHSLQALLPQIDEVWVVTPGGDEAKLSASSRRVPITRLADRIEAELT